MSLKLVRAFGQALLLGESTQNLRRFGVPPGGPFDRESYALLHALLAPTETWEVFGSSEWICQYDGWIASVGGSGLLQVNGVPSPTNGALPVTAGAEIIVRVNRGARLYVGWAPQGQSRMLARAPSSLREGPIRVLAGPDLVPWEPSGWMVSPNSDRKGLRLVGPVQPHSTELPSRPTTVGAIQITPSGAPIVLGPDGPTIGGYPQVAVIIDADLDRLGQLRAGHAASFIFVSSEEAQEERTRRQSDLDRRLAMLAIRNSC